MLTDSFCIIKHPFVEAVFCCKNLVMTISIIIPTFNESASIEKLVNFFNKNNIGSVKEVIVTDGGSHDNTAELAKAAGAKLCISPHKGRAAQMNYGAGLATGDILYFVHADSFPPISFAPDIIQAVAQGYSFGRYRTKFDAPQKILLLNAWFTRFDLFICYGGDQTLFMERKLFDNIGGFNMQMRIMEDYDIVSRAKATGARYKIFAKPALVSARKYETNSWLRVQRANYAIIRMYKKGATQEEMAVKYRQLLNYR